MKKSSYTIGSIIILLLAALVFVLVPALAGLADGAKLPPYAYYNSKPITFDDGSLFQKRAQAILQDYESRGVDLNDPNLASFYYSQSFETAFTQVLSTYMLSFFTESTGYIVSDYAIDRRIRTQPQFLDGSGSFSEARYEQLTDTEKRNLRKELREELANFRSYEDIFGSQLEVGFTPLYGLKSSSAEIDFVRNLGGKRYAFDIASFDIKQFPNEEKVAFGNAHKDLFVKYNLKVITSDDENKIKEVASRIKKTEITFEDAITEYSTKQLGDKATGTLSANTRYQLENAFTKPEYLDKVLNLKTGEVSDIIETASAYCIFKCMDSPTEPDFTNDMTVTEVYEYLLTREKSVIEDYYINKAKDFIAYANNNSFEKACDNFDVKSKSFAPFALNYNTTSLIGSTPMGDDEILRFAATNENFFKNAFKLKEDEISSPVVIGDANSVVVIRCSAITTADFSESDGTATANTINDTSKSSINEVLIYSNPRIKRNSEAFMAKFLRRAL
ncbi:MAG: peptidylprolyl isomerase [Treponema sp.]|uniref:peptidylprolyl isomerase n=1 Tax=Treponema sp. TaxID=166 RepID=UPI00298E16DB|nr:peptidylprolyl isomerase [Treponema sp.]MCR5387485.1 peptidylprolyl isomerase [Treponema sp.]